MSEIKIEHIKDMPDLKKYLIRKLWQDVCEKKPEQDWEKYNHEFIFEQKQYVFKCEWKLQSIKERLHLSYRRYQIEHKQVVLNAEDVLKGRFNCL